MYKNRIKASHRKAKWPFNRYVSAGILVVAAAGIIVLLEANNLTHFFHEEKATSGTITKPTVKHTASGQSSTKKNDPSTNTETPTPATPNSKSADPAISSNSTSGSLTVPYGNFVSNHSPGYDGAGTAEDSVCITSPGASCTIKFVKQDGADAGVVKTLDAGTADSTGTVYWKWDTSKAGFTAGNWEITAVATLNGQTQSTKDQALLKVQ